MISNRGMFLTKTMEGRLIEGFIGIGLIIITLPIMLVSVIGSLCGRVLDRITEIERDLCENLRSRGL